MESFTTIGSQGALDRVMVWEIILLETLLELFPIKNIVRNIFPIWEFFWWMSDPTTGFDPFQVDFSDHNLNVTTETASFLKKVSQVVYYPTWFNRDVQIWREENRIDYYYEWNYWVKRLKLTFLPLAFDPFTFDVKWRKIKISGDFHEFFS